MTHHTPNTDAPNSSQLGVASVQAGGVSPEPRQQPVSCHRSATESAAAPDGANGLATPRHFYSSAKGLNPLDELQGAALRNEAPTTYSGGQGMTPPPTRDADERLLQFLKWRVEGYSTVQIAKANDLSSGWVRVATNRIRNADEAHVGRNISEGYW